MSVTWTTEEVAEFLEAEKKEFIKTFAQLRKTMPMSKERADYTVLVIEQTYGSLLEILPIRAFAKQFEKATGVKIPLTSDETE